MVFKAKKNAYVHYLVFKITMFKPKGGNLYILTWQKIIFCCFTFNIKFNTKNVFISSSKLLKVVIMKRNILKNKNDN